jgi:archaellin
MDVGGKQNRMKYTLLLLIILASCSGKKNVDVNPTDITEFDVANQVSAEFEYDTINVGEALVLDIRYDSVYLIWFREKPKWVLDDSTEISISNTNHDITYMNYVTDLKVAFPDSDAIKSGIYTHTITEKFRFKLTPEKDTILTINKNFTLTNFESSKRSEGKLVNGLLEGKWTFWYDNDRKMIKEISHWSGGLRHGRLEEYWKSGGIKRVANYKDGRISGKEDHYSSSGNKYDTSAG